MYAILAGASRKGTTHGVGRALARQQDADWVDLDALLANAQASAPAAPALGLLAVPAPRRRVFIAPHETPPLCRWLYHGRLVAWLDAINLGPGRNLAGMFHQLPGIALDASRLLVAAWSACLGLCPRLNPIRWPPGSRSSGCTTRSAPPAQRHAEQRPLGSLPYDSGAQREQRLVPDQGALRASADAARRRAQSSHDCTLHSAGVDCGPRGARSIGAGVDVLHPGCARLAVDPRA